MSTIYTEWSSLFPDVAWVDISTDPQWVGAPVADQVTYEYAGTASLSFAITSARTIRLIRSSTITFTLSSSALRSRTRAYTGSASIVIGGGVSVVGLHIVDGVAALSIAGSAAISRKSVRSYASTGAIVASGSSTRCRARCAQGAAAIVTASSHGIYSHNCSRNILGSAAIITGGGSMRQRTIGRAGTAALVSGGDGAPSRSMALRGLGALAVRGDGSPSRSRVLLGLGALSVMGSAAVQRAHIASYGGSGVLSLAGQGALQRDIVIDGHASLALSSRTVLGLGIPLNAVHVVARVYPVSIAFEEILEFIYFNSPIGSFGHATSHVATDHLVKLCLAANVVTFTSPLTKFFYSHATVCIQSISDSPVERVLTFDSLSLQ